MMEYLLEVKSEKQRKKARCLNGQQIGFSSELLVVPESCEGNEVGGN